MSQLKSNPTKLNCYTPCNALEYYVILIPFCTTGMGLSCGDVAPSGWKTNCDNPIFDEEAGDCLCPDGSTYVASFTAAVGPGSDISVCEAIPEISDVGAPYSFDYTYDPNIIDIDKSSVDVLSLAASHSFKPRSGNLDLITDYPALSGLAGLRNTINP